MNYQVDVKIESISPLLQHRFPTATADQPHTRRTGRPDYKEEAGRALYRTAEGLIYQPATHLERALQQAATNFKISGRRGKSYRELVAASTFVRPDQIPHLIPEWVIDERPVVVQRSRIVRYRPRFDQWKLAFTIDVLDDQLPNAVLKELLDYAGRSVGIGDFRPRYGRFIVTQFEG